MQFYERLERIFQFLSGVKNHVLLHFFKYQSYITGNEAIKSMYHIQTNDYSLDGSSLL